MLLHSGAGGCAVGGVGALVRGLLEEVVLEGIVGRDAGLGVKVQHAQDQVLELEVVGHGVTRLPRPATPWSPRLRPDDVVEFARSGRLVLKKEKKKIGFFCVAQSDCSSTAFFIFFMLKVTDTLTDTLTNTTSHT